MNYNYNKVIDICHDYVATQFGGKVLYISEFGSLLYGTDTETTKDVDLKCIFLPFVTITDQMKMTGSFETHGKIAFDKDWNRTTNHEFVVVEIEFWSLQLWLTKFLKNGDTGAVDLAYSITKPDSNIYIDGNILEVFYNLNRCFNPLDSRSFLGYAMGQATKYGIKGVRLNILYKILGLFGITTMTSDDAYYLVKNEALESVLVLQKSNDNMVFSCSWIERLEVYIDRILKITNSLSHCHLLTDSNGVIKLHDQYRILRINGKEHHGSIYLDQFLKRMFEQVSEYGHRAHDAATTEGKDWKALSHAYRVIKQYIELLQTNEIVFPLKYANEIIQIKKGLMSIEEVKELLSKTLFEADQLREYYTSQENHRRYDERWIQSFIISCYE